MNQNAVQFLERKKVIQFFGLGLILAPFVNAILILLTKMHDYKLHLSQINLSNMLKTTSIDGCILSALSIIIGGVMLKGSNKAWRFVLFLVGFHIAIQILNYKTAAAGNILWWPFFLINATVFIFIADQLVWKIDIPKISQNKNISSNIEINKQHKVFHLKTFKKIYLQHDLITPWAEIKKMTSEGFQAFCINESPPQQILNKSVVLKLSNGLILKARLISHSGKNYFYEFYNQTHEHDQLINQWFKKIAS